MKFAPEKLSNALQASCTEVLFALLHGSAKDGQVNPGSDIDLALFIEGKPTLEFYEKVSGIVETVAAGAQCDIGILNNAEPVFRFEALKGNLLFNKDMETYLDFFSLTCREYESQMADYLRQKNYRLTKI